MIQPAVKKLYFAYVVGDGITGYTEPTIDLSLAASIANRRFYRQGLNWAVANVKVTLPEGVSQTNSNIKVKTVQDTWVACNAWKKSFALWMKMNRFAMQEAPSIKPKFFDYKVFLDEPHWNDWKINIDAAGPGYQNSAVPDSGTLAPRTAPSTSANFIKGGEWDMAKFVIPKVDGTDDASTFHAFMHGIGTATVKPIINGYAYSRALVTSPEPLTLAANTSWMTDVFQQGTDQTDEILQDLEDDNDEVPYDLDEYVGGATNFDGPQTVGFTIATTANNTGQQVEFNTGPFNAQCGLIRIDTVEIASQTGLPVIVEVTLVPGGNRGYLTQPMGDVQ